MATKQASKSEVVTIPDSSPEPESDLVKVLDVSSPKEDLESDKRDSENKRDWKNENKKDRKREKDDSKPIGKSGSNSRKRELPLGKGSSSTGTINSRNGVSSQDRRDRDSRDRSNRRREDSSYRSSSASMRRRSPDHDRGPRNNDPRSGDTKNVICRDFVRNKCVRGLDCRFYHPAEDARGDEGRPPREPLFTICHDFRMGLCNRLDCRYFHISRHDEELFVSRGEVAPQLVDEAIHKSLESDQAMFGTRPCCKGFLQGECNLPNCRSRHLSQREYENEVYLALRTELQRLLGPADFQAMAPQTLPVPHPGGMFDPVDILPEPIRPRTGTPLMPEFAEGMPRNEFEPQFKRSRYPEDQQGFMIGERDTGRRWDEWFDVERDRIDQLHRRALMDPGIDADVMQEIVNLRNMNMDLKRDAERAVDELRAELSRAILENTKFKSDAIESNNSHQMAMKNLAATNVTLLEERRKAQETAKQMEISNNELLQTLDARMQAINVEKVKVAKLEKELNDAKGALNTANARITKLENENRKLLSDSRDMRGNFQSRLDHQDASKQNYPNRDRFTRDPARSRWNDPSRENPGSRGDGGHGGDLMNQRWGEAGGGQDNKMDQRGYQDGGDDDEIGHRGYHGGGGGQDDKMGPRGYLSAGRDNMGPRGYQSAGQDDMGQRGYQSAGQDNMGQRGYQGSQDKIGQRGYQGGQDSKIGQRGYQGSQDNKIGQRGYQVGGQDKMGQREFQGGQDNKVGQRGYQVGGQQQNQQRNTYWDSQGPDQMNQHGDLGDNNRDGGRDQRGMWDQRGSDNTWEEDMRTMDRLSRTNNNNAARDFGATGFNRGDSNAGRIPPWKTSEGDGRMPSQQRIEGDQGPRQPGMDPSAALNQMMGNDKPPLLPVPPPRPIEQQSRAYESMGHNNAERGGYSTGGMAIRPWL